MYLFGETIKKTVEVSKNEKVPVITAINTELILPGMCEVVLSVV